jgi:hypothetical protein
MLESPNQLTRCYALDGTFTPVIQTMVGPLNGPCPTMVRTAGAPCPAADQACAYPGCGIHSETLTGPPVVMGDQCCYQVAQCLGASGCGRPIFVDDAARVAGVVSRRDWGLQPMPFG